MGMFLPSFKKLILRIVFKNTDNTILVLFENCSYFLNLVFYVFSMFFRKKKGIKSCYLCFRRFLEKKNVFKNCNQIGQCITLCR